jgi:hypothetical protein
LDKRSITVDGVFFSFFITKATANRKARSVVDFRKLNPMLKYVPVEFPTSEEILDDIPHGTQVFSKINLCRAYHQLRVDDENK